MNELIPIVEGAIFASSVPVNAQDIAKLFDDEEKPALAEIRKAIELLQKGYERRGIRLVEVASGFRFQVSEGVAPYIVKSVEDRPARYSRALLETLSLIAYRQPITRGEIEDIRGVVVSTNIIKTLDEQEWIRIVGYKDVPGKPALYATTKTFLDHFGLKSLEELPPLSELKVVDMVNLNDEVSQDQGLPDEPSLMVQEPLNIEEAEAAALSIANAAIEAAMNAVASENDDIEDIDAEEEAFMQASAEDSIDDELDDVDEDIDDDIDDEDEDEDDEDEDDEDDDDEDEDDEDEDEDDVDEDEDEDEIDTELEQSMSSILDELENADNAIDNE